MACRDRRQVRRREDAAAGRTERRRLRSSSSSLSARSSRLEAGAVLLEQGNGLGGSHRPGAAPRAPRWPGRCPRAVSVTPSPLRHRSSQRQAVRVALGDVVEDDADRPALARHRQRPRVGRVQERAKAMASALAAAKSSASAAAALTRHGAPRLARSGPRCATRRAARPRRRPGAPGAAAARSPASARRGARRAGRSRR